MTARRILTLFILVAIVCVSGWAQSSITITSSPAPNGIIGQNYSFQFQANQAATWSIDSEGNLPPGLSLNSTSGLLSGQLLQTGTFGFTVRATSTVSSNVTAGQSQTVVVTTGPLTLVTSGFNPRAQLGATFSSPLSGSGGSPPYAFNLVNGTQNGLSIASNTGVVSGTPLVAGVTNLVVNIRDSLGNVAGGPPISVNVIGITPTLPNGGVGTPYSQTLQAPGGLNPLTWNLVSGTLPPGLNIGSAGLISGTPTTNGTYPFVVSVSDNIQNSTSGTVTIIIGSSFQITNTSLPNGFVGSPYSQTLTATGGTGTLTWSATGLPGGLTIGAATGTISGTPNTAGSTTVNITVTDSATPTPNTATAALGLIINGPVFRITTTSPLPAGTVGILYSQVLQATGGTGPYSWSATGLPAGLALAPNCNTLSCTLTGTPTTAGSSTIGVTVTDSTNATAQTNLDIVISAPTLTITDVPAGCFIATAGRPFPDPSIKPTSPPSGCPTTYRFTVTGATGTVIWTATGLPTGLTLNSSTGTLSGTAPAAGNVPFTVIATDSQQQRGVLATSITVAALGKPVSSDIILGGNSGGPIAAGTQPALVVSITGTFPFPVSGVVTLTYASSVGGDDQLVRFGNGQRTTNFSIPANTSRTPVNDGNVVITGTVSGTISLSATFKDDFGNDMTPTAPHVVTYTVTAAPPVITKVVITNATATGMTIAVTGFSTPRNMSSAVFHFTPTSTTNLGSGVGTPVDVTVQVGPQFTTWYGSSASNAFGSQFTMIVPFTFSATGPATVAPVASVTVNMTNSVGTSATSTPVSP